MKYQVAWKGFDQGVEHTWNPDFWEKSLNIIASLQPVNYRDPKSPIYDELEKLYPDKTWRNYDPTTGEFRNIFRRSNVLEKLGLVNNNKGILTLSPLGEDLVVGKTNAKTILVDACASHNENGEKPFSIIAEAFIAYPQHVFTFQEIAFGIMANFRPANDDLSEALRIANETSAEIDATPKRRLRRILKALEMADAIQAVNTTGWRAKQINVLEEILNRNNQLTIFKNESSDLSQKSHEQEFSKVSAYDTGNSREYKANQNLLPFKHKGKAHDPAQRLDLLEKASKGHSKTLDELAAIIKRSGYTPLENPNSYDLMFIDGGFKRIFEVKTWTSQNLKSQIRKGIIQLYEYSWAEKANANEGYNLYLVFSSNPSKHIEDDYFDFLINDRGIIPCWIEDGNLSTHITCKKHIDWLKA